MFEIKNRSTEINGKLNITEEKICKLKTIETIQNEKQEKKVFK